MQDKSGMMWFGTWNGLCRYDGYDFVVFKSQAGDGTSVKSDRVRDIVLGSDGNLYCKLEDQVYRFNLTTYKYETISAKEGERRLKEGHSSKQILNPLPYLQYSDRDDANTSCFRDMQNNIWVPGKYHVTRLSTIAPPMQPVNGVSNAVVRCMYRDSKGRIWIGTREDERMCILSPEGKLIGYLSASGHISPSPSPFCHIYCMTEMKDETVWIGSKPDGLYRLRPTSSSSYSVQHIEKGSKAGMIPNENIYYLKEDKKGRLWVATQGGGFYLCENPNADKPVFTSVSSLINKKFTNTEMQRARRFFFTDDGHLLVTTTGGLVVIENIYKPLQQFRFHVHKREPERANSLSNSATMDIACVGKDIYISTESGGINRLLTADLNADKFEFEHFGIDEGLGSDITNAMTVVGDEIMVVCSDQVSLFNTKTRTSRNYNQNFWTQPLQFSDAEPIRLPNGTWIFSLEGGAVSIHESRFKTKTFVPHIAMTSVGIENEPLRYNVDSKDTILLGADQRTIIINYASIDFSSNQRPLYQTRIGKDGTWSSPSDSHQLALYNLSPGTYEVQIRSTNAQGLWTDNIRTITIVVEPHWYETIWAMLLYLLIIIGAISGITYLILYIKGIKKQRRDVREAYLSLLAEKRKAELERKAEAEEKERKKKQQRMSPVYNIKEDKGTREQPAPAAEKVTEVQPIAVVPHLSPDDKIFMTRLMQYVEENLGNSNIGVDDIATATAMSRSSLTRKMKQIVGITPADFLKEARIKSACQQLVTTDSNVSTIAYAVGFADPKYFTKCFKASVGMSPSEYRDSQK